MTSHSGSRASRVAGFMAMLIGAMALVLGMTGTSVGAQGNSQGNPPGNNGTVKINGEDLKAGGRGNDPHVPCSFSVSFWNFDAGAGASVTFAAHPPTGRTTLLGDSFSLDGDGADGSQDASVSYNLASALSSFTPHPQQGYHVKLTVHAEGSQGADTKHKVFWVTCPTTTTVPPTTTTTVGGTTTSAPATTTTTAAVLGVTVTPAAPQVAAQADPADPARALPSELARTGSAEPWLRVGSGLALLVCGTGMVLVGRRRAISL